MNNDDIRKLVQARCRGCQRIAEYKRLTGRALSPTRQDHTCRADAEKVRDWGLVKATELLSGLGSADVNCGATFSDPEVAHIAKFRATIEALLDGLP